MGAAGGPNIATDGLVFGYDLGNTLRSYPGIPAVNCARVPTTSGNGNSTGNWTVTEITDGSVTPPREGARVFKFVAGTTSNLYRQANYYAGGGFSNNNPQNSLILGRTSPSNFTTVSEANKYRWGFWVKGDAANNAAWGFSIDIGDKGGASYTVGNNTNWYFISCDNANGINSTTYPYDFFDIFSSNQGLIMYVADMGIYRSPGTVDSLPILQAWPQWVDYGQERRYTAGLRDMIGTSAIDLSDVSFDSNAQVTFDGTDESFEIGTSVAQQGNLGSIEVVFKAHDNHRGAMVGWGDLGTSNWGSFEIGPATSGFTDEFIGYINASSGNGYTLVMYGRDSSAGSYKLNDNQYHHVVAVVDGSKNTIYVDGEEVGTLSYQYGTATSAEFIKQTSTTNVRIGNSTYNGGHIPFDGEIPLVKIYNRGLTAQEVQNNFNGVKKRFGI